MVQTALEIVFWISLFLVFYTYLGYAVLVSLFVRIKHAISPKQEIALHKKEELPTCSLVIPAYNEADFIADKARNSLDLDYPEEKLEIIFVTDGSNDGTPDVLRKIPGVQVWHSDDRKGKIAAMNRAMTKLQSEITVFCDANTMLNKLCLRELVKHYQDPSVGGVSGEKIVLSETQDAASGAGEGIYWKYESYLKRKDAELKTLVGSAGELFSIRTALYQPVEADSILDDFMVSMRLVQDGYKVAYEPAATASETASVNVAEEYKRKVRIAAGGFQSIQRLKKLYNPIKYGLVTFEFVSHRVMRWAVAPFMLPIIFLSNLVLAQQHAGGLYQLLMLGQVVFYGAALLGWVLESRKLKVKLLFVPFYFSMMNYAVIAGYLRFVKGSQTALWEKSKRRQ